jgi:hypothetical protein
VRAEPAAGEEAAAEEVVVEAKVSQVGFGGAWARVEGAWGFLRSRTGTVQGPWALVKEAAAEEVVEEAKVSLGGVVGWELGQGLVAWGSLRRRRGTVQGSWALVKGAEELRRLWRRPRLVRCRV